MSIVKLPAITLWQPWASLLAAGFKTHETRQWPAPEKLIGERFVIHSAKRPIDWDFALLGLTHLFEECDARLGLDWRESLPLGCALGTARLTRVRRTTQTSPLCRFDQLAGNWGKGRWAWRFEDNQAFPEPIPMRGYQRIWYAEIPRELVRRSA